MDGVLSMDIVHLIHYTHAVRRRYLKAMNELSWDEIVKDRGASFPSIRDIFLHALNAEDRLINYVILGKSEQWAPEDFGKFVNTKKIEERVNEVEKNVETYLEKLTKRELDRTIELPWRKGIPIRIEDVLIHIAIEDASHMGELIALMWQFDKQPPYLSWSAFIEQGTS